ncbi:MAG: hypothetical protein H6511_07425 [Holophagales bacterium]|nr:hypothetical protein [Holophagales bacterium]
MTRSTRTLAPRMAFALAALLAGGACRAPSPAVARLDARPAHLRLGFGEAAEVELAFEPLAALPRDARGPTVFLHLLDESGLVVRTFDHPLPGDWRPGEEIRYRVRIHQSALADPLEPGIYTLAAGLYDRDDGRYALETLGGEVAREEYRVAIVEVPALVTAMPHARFSEGWRPTEAGIDRQVVARRKLGGAGPGSIQFGPLDGPGKILVGIVVPASGGSQRVELQPDAGMAKLQIASSCGGEIEVTGPGAHDLEIDVPAGAPATCSLEVRANFLVRSGESAEATSARLELLAWMRTPGGA